MVIGSALEMKEGPTILLGCKLQELKVSQMMRGCRGQVVKGI